MMSSLSAVLFLGASMAYAANTIVTVGAGGQLAFAPNQVVAAVGDTISFQFEGGVRLVLVEMANL
jgi:plastocyanin